MIERVLIISDIHNRIERANRIINHEAPDKIVFIGDAFDDFGDGPTEARATARWLKPKLHDSRFVIIKGNHCCPYYRNNIYTQCSGFTAAKFFAIKDILDDRDWEKSVFYYWLDEKTLISHAGLTLPLMGKIRQPAGPKTLAKIKRVLEQENEQAIKALKNGESHWFFRAGRDRGGRQPYGGLTWCDASSFRPIQGVRQIFGHTPMKEPLVYNNGDIAFDTHNNHWLIYIDGNIQIKSYMEEF